MEIAKIQKLITIESNQWLTHTYAVLSWVKALIYNVKQLTPPPYLQLAYLGGHYAR